MRIEHIELENWMSYPRRWTPPGQPDSTVQVVPTIDLSGQPLVLISGDNGAGKSAILEAICYALFAKYPRGNNEDAIRSGETSAAVRLDFTLPTAKGEVTYRVERTLSKRAGGTTALLTQLRADGPPLTLQSGQKAVTDYVIQDLLRGVEYDAFASAVFLRQEEAGKFMELSHAAQRAQLLRLCRLEIYAKIYERAHAHLRALTDRVKELQAQFASVEYATELHLSARRKDAENLEARRNGLRRDEEVARQLLDKVKRAVMLDDEIRQGKQKLAQWEQVLRNADEIHHASRWIIAWERIHNTLIQGARLSESVARREGEIEQARQDLAAATQEAAGKKTVHNDLALEHQRHLQALNDVKDALLALSGRRSAARDALATAREAQRLDRDIASIRAEQDAREADLARFDEVKRQKDYRDLLTRAENALQFALQTLGEAEEDLSTAQARETEANTADREAAQLQNLLEDKGSQLQALESTAETLRARQGELHRQQDASEDVIANRNKAVAAGVCPTCGTELKGEIGEHVCQEIEYHQATVAVAKQELAAVAVELENNRIQITQLKDEVKRWDRRRAALESQASQAGASARKSRDSAARRRQQAASQWQQHLNQWRDIPPPDWLQAPSPAMQEIVDAELRRLADIEAQFSTLTDVRATYRSQAQVLDREKRSRADLEIESPVTDAQIAELDAKYRALDGQVGEAEARRDRLQRTVKDAEDQVQEARQQWTAAEKCFSAVDKNLTSLKASQSQEQGHLAATRQTLQTEQRRIGSSLPDLTADLLDAVDSPTTLSSLEDLAQAYGRQASQLADLEQAQTDSTRVQTEIELKQRALDDLGAEVGSVTEVVASERWQELQAHLTSAERDLMDLNREIGNTERDCQRRHDLELQLKDGRKQQWAFRTIEDAIDPGTKTRAPGPLFALITQRLMESISLEASHILAELGWPIGIAYYDKHGFTIEDRALSAVRKYGEYSGGERFAIAIAVALAIGRVTHGAGNIRCLFIDEGFGALDQKHRKRIIDDAIGRLVEIGSRDQVVVISHLADMQAYFPNRVELRRDGDRSAPGLPTEESL